jgi:hypothetical protein
VPASWCLLFGFGWEMFVGTGDSYENVPRMCGECASVVAPVFFLFGWEHVVATVDNYENMA